MSDLKSVLTDSFTKKLKERARKKGELDTRVSGLSEAAAETAAELFLETAPTSKLKANGEIEEQYIHYKIPDENGDYRLTKSNIRLGGLIGLGGQHAVFRGYIDDFDELRLPPFYIHLRKHQILSDNGGGTVDDLRSEFTLEAQEELEYLLSRKKGAAGAKIIKNTIIHDLKSKFRDGNIAVRVPLRRESDLEDNLNRATALDGLVHDNLLFSAGRYDNEEGRSIQLVQYVDSLIEPLEVYKTVSSKDIAKLLMGSLQGLKVIDDLGLAHRDIKPDNIMLAKGKRKITPIVSDFDIVRIVKRSHGPSMTQTQGNMFKGTPRYATPQHVHTPDKLDVRADIIDLGLTGYLWWTGYHAIYENVEWRKDIEELRRAKVINEALERDSPPVFPTYIATRAPYQLKGKLSRGRKREMKNFEESLELALAKMMTTDLTQVYQKPQEAINHLKRLLDGYKLDISPTIRSINYGGSRSDIDNGKKRKRYTN
jgi:serine/threonine protein kinase